jgi:hypothetical protein
MKNNQTPLPTAFCLVTEGGKHHSIQRSEWEKELRIWQQNQTSKLTALIDYAKSRFTR